MTSPPPPPSGAPGDDPMSGSSVSLDGLFGDNPAPDESVTPAVVLEDALPDDVFSNPMAATIVPEGQKAAPAPPAAPPAPMDPSKTAIDVRANLSDTQRFKSALEGASRIAIAPPTATKGDGLPALGSVIDKYRIEELLGTGGFAAVYRATHLLLRVPVAIKLLLPKIVRNQPKLADLLCEEARFTAQVSHPNVVRVMDVTHTDQLTYLVMEYVEGPSLSAVIQKQKRLHPKDVIHVGMDICNGLKSALEQGLIHRDIKPANILIAKSGIAKIVDLGLARPSAIDPLDKLKNTTSLPKGAVVGTPLYMSPEQAVQPDAVDFKSDIYSLGVTLYHAAVGNPPFTAGSHVELIYKHQHAQVPTFEASLPGFPPDLAQLIAQMMAKSPQDRPRSYDELLETLQTISNILAVEESENPENKADKTILQRLRRFFK